MCNIEEIVKALLTFRDERNWKPFHDTKNLSAAISIEAGELNELFLWKDAEESEKVDKDRIKEELADVFAFSFLLAEKHGLDVKEIVLEKINKNADKCPINKAKGNASKYDEF
jgi:NTP pyrophosphatase (non-canonical NTP hydrolase)